MPTYLKIFLASLLSKVLIFFIGKNQKKKINNVFFNLDISEGIDLRLFLNFLEEKNLYKSLNKILETDKNYNFVDVGANIGSVSLHLANVYKKSKIYAIEPSYFAFKKLKSNLSINKMLKKRVKLFNLSISSSTKKNNYSYASWKLNFDNKSHPIHKGILKKTATTKSSLNKFLKKLKKVDFIKIDTDGNEFSILSSGINEIKKQKPIIHIEFAPYLHEENGFSTVRLINLIEKNLNYKFLSEKLVKVNNMKKYASKIGHSSENFFIVHKNFILK
tara:strand:- start:1352 stop:2176 length:825 start_codon:yes stop_codon:yes gene_type:complete